MLIMRGLGVERLFFDVEKLFCDVVLTWFQSSPGRVYSSPREGGSFR